MENRILEIIRGSIGPVSGEALSKELKVSRTAIWKYINQLRAEGYKIESSSRTGYRLTDTPEGLSAIEIGSGLRTVFVGQNIRLFKSIDSTNNYAKQLAAEGCPHGTTVLSEAQSSGRGRLGRNWSSPESSGIWMSVVLKPDIPPGRAQLMTLGAADSVAETIKEATGIDSGIKWPNDILLGGRKVCGLLTEMGCEMDKINYLVVGIGMNVSQMVSNFPPELRDTATSLEAYAAGEGITIPRIKRNDIIKLLLEKLEKYFGLLEAGRTSEILATWKKYSVTLGKEIKVISNGGERYGTAIGITDEGSLVVRFDNGEVREINSGEVSIRNKE